MYSLDFSPDALTDIAKLKRSEPLFFKKLDRLLNELREHPATGTGHPKPLKGTSVPTWSRTISKKHRLVYEILDDKVMVYVLSAYGHYDDK